MKHSRSESEQKTSPTGRKDAPASMTETIDNPFAPLNYLLAGGGDTRIIINPTDGMNVYGCTPFPRPEALTFASSTASSISERAYGRAAQALTNLMEATPAKGLEEAYQARVEQARDEFKNHLGIEDLKTGVVFSPSGTDSQLHALFVAQQLLGHKIVSVIVAANETGSGTTFTAVGKHFNARTSHGVAVEKGDALPELAEGTTSLEISLRNEDGSTKSAEAMDRTITDAVAAAINSGNKVLLQIMDCSKLGWRSPSQKCLRDLCARWKDQVQVVVDACQMRLGRKRIRKYLDTGYMVLLTGSKFYTGAPFSGALLVPEQFSAKLASVTTVSSGLHDYTNRSDWPMQWPGIRAALPSIMNLGQWLRWEAALEEMRAYFAVPLSFRLSMLQKFAVTTAGLIGQSPSLEIFPDQPKDPSDDIDDEEMATRTIIPFYIRGRDGRRLSPDACKKLYLALNRDMTGILPSTASVEDRRAMQQACHIGQPVTMNDAAVLRINASARVVSECWSTNETERNARVQAALDGVKLVLRKVEILLDHFSAIDAPAAANDPVRTRMLLDNSTEEIPVRLGVAKLAKMAFDGIDLQPLWDKLHKEFTDNPLNTATLMDMAIIAQIGGQQEAGLAIQMDALKMGRVYRIPCATPKPRLRVLAIAAAVDIGANTPIEFLLEDTDIDICTLYVVPGLPLPDPLPPHDVAIVVSAESDETRETLAEITRLMAVWPRPVLNLPLRINELNRDRLYHLLKGAPGLYIPMTARVSRQQLTDIARDNKLLRESLEDGVFPLIVRPVDSHAGRGLSKLEGPGDIKTYLHMQPEADFFISRYIDYSSSDGQFRKYRVVFVDGKPHACHMAISEQWKIWYLNAQMAESVSKREEEAHFMQSFDDEFAKRHHGALAETAKRLGLEYFALDCAETKDGQLLVFEGGNTMIVHNMDPPAVYPYKPPQMKKVFKAFAAMLSKYAGK